MESIYGVQGRNCWCCANHILINWCNISLIVRMHMAQKRNCMHAPHAASTLRFYGKDAVLQIGHADCCLSFHSCLLCIHALICRSRVQTKTSKNLLCAANCMIACYINVVNLQHFHIFTLMPPIGGSHPWFSQFEPLSQDSTENMN
jgi:hypothetical protein